LNADDVDLRLPLRDPDSRGRATAPHILPESLSWPTAVGFMALYAALLWAGYALRANSTAVTTLWPADGLLFSTLLLLRKRAWPRILVLGFVVDLAVNRLVPGPFHLDSAIWYGVTHALDGAVGAGLAQSWARTLSSPRDALMFYLAAAIGGAISTTVGVFAFLSNHPEANLFEEWWRWWGGTFLGVVTFAPIVFKWIAHWRRRQDAQAATLWWRIALPNALLMVFTVWIFGATPASSDLGSSLSFAIFPLLALIALLTPSRWTVISSAAVVVLAAALTNHGLGPLADAASPLTGVLPLQGFLALAATMTFMMSLAADENRELLAALGISRDRHLHEARLLRGEVEQRQALEQQHAMAERRNAQLATLLHHSREVISIASLDGRGDFINEVGRQLLGIGPDEDLGGRAFSDFVHPRDRDRLVLEIMPTIIAQGHWSGELDFRRVSDNSEIAMLVEAFRIDDEQGRPLSFAALSLDITERKATAARLLASEARLRTIINTEPDCVKVVRQDGSLLDMNEAGVAMLEAASIEEARAHGLANFICPEHVGAFAELHRRVIAGQRGELDFEVVGLRGTRRWLRTSAAPMFDATLGETVLVGITSDITERRHDVERLRALNEELANRVQARTAALKEREVMLQEIHHRVKNNLQVIASLINMQSRTLVNTATRLALQQCRSRVETMSEIHEMLYQSKDYAQVPFGKFAKDLATRVLSASGSSNTAVALEFDLEDLSLPVHTAIPCGLILNELVANSIKHAFPDAASGKIRVELRRVADHEALLSVSDDGIGIAPQFDAARADSLGIQLVITLVEQLDAHLEIVRQPGATFRITFPVGP
jgi:PAS domain S-box-containing protein